MKVEEEKIGFKKKNLRCMRRVMTSTNVFFISIERTINLARTKTTILIIKREKTIYKLVSERAVLTVRSLSDSF